MSLYWLGFGGGALSTLGVILLLKTIIEIIEKKEKGGHHDVNGGN